jgi:hypothetical protein
VPKNVAQGLRDIMGKLKVTATVDLKAHVVSKIHQRDELKSGQTGVCGHTIKRCTAFIEQLYAAVYNPTYGTHNTAYRILRLAREFSAMRVSK